MEKTLETSPVAIKYRTILHTLSSDINFSKPLIDLIRILSFLLCKSSHMEKIHSHD